MHGLSLWPTLVLYLLGISMYLALLEAADEEGDPNVVLYTALAWPYVAVRIIIDHILYGDDEDERYK